MAFPLRFPIRSKVIIRILIRFRPQMRSYKRSVFAEITLDQVYPSHFITSFQCVIRWYVVGVTAPTTSLNLDQAELLIAIRIRKQN